MSSRYGPWAADSQGAWNLACDIPYSREQADFSKDQQVKLGIVGNAGNSTLGDFDEARIKRVIDIVVPIYDGQRKPVKPGLAASDLFTNEFIDPSIGL